MTKPNIDTTLLSQYTNRDICTVEVKLLDETIIVSSIYLPPNDDVTLLLQMIHNIGNLSNSKIIICGDFNAHPQDWEAGRTNTKGRDVSDLFASLNFYLLNTGNTPTFYTIRNGVELQSIIDLTFISSNLIAKIHNRQVCEDHTSSDHHRINFAISTATSSTKSLKSTRRYATRNIDWSRFINAITLRKQEWKRKIELIACLQK